MKQNFFKIGILICFCAKIYAHPGVGIVKNSKGEIFYTDTERVWKINADGKTTKVVVPNVHTHDLAIDELDNIYGEHLWYEGEATNKWGHYVWKYSADGQFTKIIPDTEGFLENYSFNRDSKGNLYWLQRGNQQSIFMKKTAKGVVEVLSTIKTTDVRWQFCTAKGLFYFIDDNDLKKIENGKTITIASNLDGFAGENPKRKPNNNTFGIWDDADGNLYVAVANQKVVKKVMPNGTVSVVYKSAIGWFPTGGLIDKNKKLWVLECNKLNKVRVLKQ